MLVFFSRGLVNSLVNAVHGQLLLPRQKWLRRAGCGGTIDVVAETGPALLINCISNCLLMKVNMKMRLADRTMRQCRSLTWMVVVKRGHLRALLWVVARGTTNKVSQQVDITMALQKQCAERRSITEPQREPGCPLPGENEINMQSTKENPRTRWRSWSWWGVIQVMEISDRGGWRAREQVQHAHSCALKRGANTDFGDGGC